MKRSPAPTPVILVGHKGRLSSDGDRLGKFVVTQLGGFSQTLKLDAQHELSVVLCDSATIRRINRKWRNMDKPTDVLSFPQQQVKAGKVPAPGPIGDIIVSLPYARRAARELGIEFEDHFSHLLLHGLLHLLGYDHVRGRDARVMESLERKMLGRK